MDKADTAADDRTGDLDFTAFTDRSGHESAEQLKDVPVSRRRLVGPVFLILFVSFSSILGFMWLSSRDLNDDALSRDRLVLANLLAADRVRLLETAQRESSSDALKAAIERQLRGAQLSAVLEQIFQRSGSLDGLWAVLQDGRVLAAAESGVPIADWESFLSESGIAAMLSDAGTLEEKSVSSFVRYDGTVRIAAAAASPSTIIEPGIEADEPSSTVFLVMTKPIMPETFDKAPFRIGVRGLSLDDQPAPSGQAQLDLPGPGDTVAGYLVWAPRRPGDQLLWPLSPAFALGLIAIGYFLFLFVRGADLFIDRQAYLAASLQQEQTIRNLKTRFVSMVSHEIRTPLAAIRSATELLERYGERMSDKDKAEELSAIHRAVDALTRLVDNVVAMGKSEWLKSPEPARNVDLVELCQEIWDEDMRAWESHRLVVKQSGAPRVVRIDVAYLRALLSNLMQNAAKYSPGHPEILVEVDFRPRGIVIRVTDHGIGIPKDEIGMIFDPFRRAKNAESISGSGLGLAIARAAAKALGCKLSVKSTQGEGTTFEVAFPKR